MYSMNNYYKHWGKLILKNGFKAIKNVIGVGLAFSFGVTIHPIVGILFFAWVLMEALID
jgi:hypothetical protein